MAVTDHPCLASGCREPQCNRKFIRPSDSALLKIRNIYCKHHTCHAYDKATGAFCPREVPEKHHAYCTDHRSCAVSGCREKPDLPSHMLGDDPRPVGYHDVRPEPGKRFLCPPHEYQQRMYAESQARERAARQQANTTQPSYSQQYRTQTPSQPTPTQPTPAQPTPQPRCSRPNCPSPAEDQGLCTKHLNTCTSESCTNPGQRAATGEQLLCTQHTCTHPRCAAHKPASAQACLTHRCVAPSCLSLATKGTHCRLHACSAADCAAPHATGFDYCDQHKCRRPSCGRNARVEGGFCDRAGHGCANATCKDPPGGQGKTPELCLKHASEQFERELTAEMAARAEAEVESYKRALDTEYTERMEAASRSTASARRSAGRHYGRGSPGSSEYSSRGSTSPGYGDGERRREARYHYDGEARHVPSRGRARGREEGYERDDRARYGYRQPPGSPRYAAAAHANPFMGQGREYETYPAEAYAAQDSFVPRGTGDWEDPAVHYGTARDAQRERRERDDGRARTGGYTYNAGHDEASRMRRRHDGRYHL